MTWLERLGRWAPWFALGAAAVATVAFAGRGSRAPGELENPPESVAAPAASAPAPRPSGEASPLMTRAEARDFRVHIGHEECEQGAARVNELEGRDKFAPDPKTLTELSVCLRIGNVAWLKCILGARARDEASVCTRRFLSLDHPPP